MTDSQLSPGGQWWWTGTEWVAAADHPDGRAALSALAAPAGPPVATPAPALPAQPVPPVVAAPEPAFVASAAVAEPAFASVGATPVLEHAAPAYGWAPPAPEQQVAPWPGAKPPFDTLGLVSILCNLFPFFALGQVAAVLVARKADQERAKLGYPRSTLSAVGRVLGWVFGVLIVIGMLAAVLIPVFVSKHDRAGSGHVWTKADNDAVLANTRSAAMAELAHFRTSGSYEGLSGLSADGFAPTQGVSVDVLHADSTRYCLQLSFKGRTGWYDSTTDNLSDVARCS